MQAIARTFWKVEGPTWILAVAIYGAWFLLMWFHAWIPWWTMIFLGGYVIAWRSPRPSRSPVMPHSFTR